MAFFGLFRVFQRKKQQEGHADEEGFAFNVQRHFFMSHESKLYLEYWQPTRTEGVSPTTPHLLLAAGNTDLFVYPPSI